MFPDTDRFSLGRVFFLAWEATHILKGNPAVSRPFCQGTGIQFLDLLRNSRFGFFYEKEVIIMECGQNPYGCKFNRTFCIWFAIRVLYSCRNDCSIIMVCHLFVSTGNNRFILGIMVIPVFRLSGIKSCVTPPKYS